MQSRSQCRRLLLTFFLFLSTTGCTHLFLQPNNVRYPFVEEEGLVFRESQIPSLDGTLLSAWYFPAVENGKAFPNLKLNIEKSKGLVVQFHGNAENMTSHYRFLSWLPLQGYDLLTFDYRGYGQSAGERDVKGAYEDCRAMIREADRLAKEKNLPLVLIGESLGGSLLLRALQDEKPVSLKLVLVESSFYSYSQIAREKLASFWLTWPFQWLAYLLINNSYSPGGKDLAKIQSVPTILLYSKDDPIVPYHHGEQIFNDLPRPKTFWHHPVSGHVNGMFVERGKYRQRFLGVLKGVIEGETWPSDPSNERPDDPHVR